MLTSDVTEVMPEACDMLSACGMLPALLEDRGTEMESHEIIEYFTSQMKDDPNMALALAALEERQWRDT